MKLISYRPDAQVEQTIEGFLAVCPVLLAEFLTPGRVAALGTKTELTLKPGVIYKAFTGVGFTPAPSVASVYVRATADSWRAGLYPLRVEFDHSGEMLVYFTVAAGMEFVRRNPLFEICLRPSAVDGGIPTSVSDHVKASVAPEGLSIAVAGERHLKGHMAPAPAVEADTKNAEAVVKAWLNEPDPRGRVVEAADTPERTISTTARVQGITLPGAGDDQRVSATEFGLEGALESDPSIAEDQGRVTSEVGQVPELVEETLPTTPDTSPEAQRKVEAFLAVPGLSPRGTKTQDVPNPGVAAPRQDLFNLDV